MKNNQKKFKPAGPFNIEFENKPGGKRITREHVNRFWKNHNDLHNIRSGKGIYIFGMKIASGIIPCYVGKTKNSFEGECFTDRNMNIYNGEIIEYKRKYKPFIFFLVYQPQRKQKISDKVIRELETHIINLASGKNPDLVNIRGIEDDDRFFIERLGGHGSGRGALTKEGRFFKTMMNF